MKKYIDSKNGIYTDGYNHYVVDLSVYPFLTDAATIDNADEIIGIFKKVHAHGGQLTGVTESSGQVTERGINILSLTESNKALKFVTVSSSNANGGIIYASSCTYSSGTWTVGIKTATTAWDA